MITLVTPTVEILDDSNYMRTMVFAGRLTHGLEEKYVSDEDDVAYIERMKVLGHGRVFEFGTIYLTISEDSASGKKDIPFFLTNRYSKVRSELHDNGHTTYYITTNYRVLLQGYSKNWKTAIRTNYKDNLLHLLSDETIRKGKTEHHVPRIMILWKNISRVTADSFRTHTMLSSLMQSTRYCNYSNARFGKSIKIARSVMWNELWQAQQELKDETYNSVCIKRLNVSPSCKAYLLSVDNAAKTYNKLTLAKYGEKVRPECARGLLPLDIATTFVQCGFVDDWDDFLRQRIYEHGAHPDARYITSVLLDKDQDGIFTKNVE